MNLFPTYQKWLAPGFINDAPWAEVQMGGGPYHVALVHHLSGKENGGQHNAFVDVLDANNLPGRPADLRIGWEWLDKRADENAYPVKFDKQAGEPGANFSIFKNMVVSLWLEDSSGHVLSDIVRGLRTDIEADPATGNSLYHHSYYIIFRQGAVIPTIPTLTLEERVTRIEKRLGL